MERMWPSFAKTPRKQGGLLTLHQDARKNQAKEERTNRQKAPENMPEKRSERMQKNYTVFKQWTEMHKIPFGRGRSHFSLPACLLFCFLQALNNIHSFPIVFPDITVLQNSLTSGATDMMVFGIFGGLDPIFLWYEKGRQGVFHTFPFSFRLARGGQEGRGRCRLA